MNGTDNNWRRVFRARFPGREDIGKEGVYARYWEADGLPKEGVIECLELIEEEYDLPGGLLRPEDRLDKLFEPVETRNPWRWLVYHTIAEDGYTEINYELSLRMEKHGTVGKWEHIETIDDLIRAWCGREPSS